MSCVCGGLGSLALVHLCARLSCCLCRVRCPLALVHRDACLVCCVCSVRRSFARVHRFARLVCCFCSVCGRLALVHRCARLVCCLCGVLGLLAPVYECACLVCCLFGVLGPLALVHQCGRHVPCMVWCGVWPPLWMWFHGAPGPLAPESRALRALRVVSAVSMGGFVCVCVCVLVHPGVLAEISVLASRVYSCLSVCPGVPAGLRDQPPGRPLDASPFFFAVAVFFRSPPSWVFLCFMCLFLFSVPPVSL